MGFPHVSKMVWAFLTDDYKRYQDPYFTGFMLANIRVQVAYVGNIFRKKIVSFT